MSEVGENGDVEVDEKRNVQVVGIQMDIVQILMDRTILLPGELHRNTEILLMILTSNATVTEAAHLSARVTVWKRNAQDGVSTTRARFLV